MKYIPHNDSNIYICFMFVRLLKIKTIKSYVSLVEDIANETLGFEKNINFVNKNTIKNLSSAKEIIIPNTVKHIYVSV